MALDQVVLPVFACEGLSSAKAFALWKETLDASHPVNLILQEQGEAGKGSVTLDLRGLSAFHVLKLLADRTGAHIEFTRNVLHVRLP
jgi:hypothetical protein